MAKLTIDDRLKLEIGNLVLQIVGLQTTLDEAQARILELEKLTEPKET